MPPASGTAFVVKPADYHKWESPSDDFSIFLRLDLVDGLLSDVMSAFGALPKRGAETGGILLGRMEDGAVRIEGFEHVPCSYRRGPSYLLCESELGVFDSIVRKHSGTENGLAPVGYYRSHTRDRESLADDDRTLLARFFPPPHGIMLLIQPRVSRPSSAGFLTYDNGRLPDWPPTQFLLNRRESDGVPDNAPPHTSRRPPQPPLAHEFSFSGYAGSGVKEARSKVVRRRNLLLPAMAAFLCLALGLGAGIVARPLIPALNAPDHDPFVISLAAKRVDNRLVITWDRDAPAVRYAQRGTLQIVDGQFTKIIDLSANELQNGSVVFHNSSEHVTLRLEVVVHQLSKLAESIEWEYVPPR